MLYTGSRTAAAVAFVIAVLAATGCGGGSDHTTTPASARSVTTTPSATVAATRSGATGAASTSPARPARTGPLASDEVLWLAAIPAFMTRVEKAFSSRATELTPAELRSYESLFRSCRDSLEHGVPSERLRPVSALVVKACGEYDRGATCFATAARIGTPIHDSKEEKEFTQAIDCGFAAQRTGASALVDAMNKGEEIRSAAG